MRIRCPEFQDRLDPLLLGHEEVRDDQIGPGLPEGDESCGSLRGIPDEVAVPLQDPAQDEPQVIVVVDDQDAGNGSIPPDANPVL